MTSTRPLLGAVSLLAIWASTAQAQSASSNEPQLPATMTMLNANGAAVPSAPPVTVPTPPSSGVTPPAAPGPIPVSTSTVAPQAIPTSGAPALPAATGAVTTITATQGVQSGPVVNAMNTAPGAQPPAPPAAQPGQQAQAAQTQPALVIPGMNPGATTANGQAQPPMSGQGNVQQTQLPPLPNDQSAYEAALQTNIPMTPQQILQYRQIQSQVQQAETVPVGTPPTPISRSLILSLMPGLAPQAINLYPGNATTLTFADRTGAPWPVTSVTVGNPNAYTANTIGEKNSSNMVVISPTTPYAQENNITITLKDCPVPLSFSLQTGTKTVDYRVDMSIQGDGPNASPQAVVQTSLAPTDDSTTQAFLDGVPPSGAVKLKSTDPQIQGWKYKSMYYVRTSMTMLSPAYVHSAQNLTVNVYTMTPAPVIIVSDNGRMSSVQLSLN